MNPVLFKAMVKFCTTNQLLFIESEAELVCAARRFGKSRNILKVTKLTKIRISTISNNQAANYTVNQRKLLSKMFLNIRKAFDSVVFYIRVLLQFWLHEAQGL